MILYKIYRIPDFIHRDGSKGKIGCSKNLEQRIRRNKKLSYGPFEFWELLETHTDKATASRRERELQEEYGYVVDGKSYLEITSIDTVAAGKKGGKSRKESGGIGKLGKKWGKINGQSKNSIEARRKLGKKWGSINIKKVTLEQKSKGGRIGGLKRSKQPDFNNHLKIMTKKSVKNRVKEKIDRMKSILDTIPTKQFITKDIREACSKFDVSDRYWKTILKEKSLVKRIHKGTNQFNPSIYEKVY